MKTLKIVNKICWILGIVFALGSVLLFFTDFATITTDGNNATLIGAELGFGSKIEVANTSYDMAKSADIWFCFWVTVLAAVLGIFSFKSKGIRYAAPAFGALSGIYMLVIALSDAWKFVDTRPLPSVTNVVYKPFVLLTAIAILVFTLLALAYLLIDDYIEVAESEDKKRTIFKRIIHFFRDYKSEVKKIVWPGWKLVIKNTVIVIVICLIIGAFIWAVDFGLAKLLELILGV